MFIESPAGLIYIRHTDSFTKGTADRKAEISGRYHNGQGDRVASDTQTGDKLRNNSKNFENSY